MNQALNFETDSAGALPSASAEEIAAASFYDTSLVPALFSERAAQIVAAARIEPGARVLDVACGTGVVAREVAVIVGPETPPVGLDIAPGMLNVASRVSPQIDWRHGSAEALPFSDASFDRVICQFGLMFFDDPVKALQEMLRVLKPGGRLAVSVWDSIALNPGSSTVHDILHRIAGASAAEALAIPYRLGENDDLRQLADAAGFRELDLVTCPGEQNFPSLDLLIDAEIRGWLPIMGIRLDEATIESIRDACEKRLAAYVDPRDGSLHMPGSALIATGSR